MTHAPNLLAAYLNPIYWDGTMLGQDGASALPDLAASWKSAPMAVAVLEATLENFDARRGPTKFSDGSRFDGDEQRPGTVVLLRTEELQTKGLFTGVQNHGQAVPRRRTDMSSGINSEQAATPARTLSDGGVTYRDAVSWGILVESGKKPAVLETVAVNDVIPDYRQVPRGARVLTAPGQFTIGQTEHYRDKRGERLMRVNALEIVNAGEPTYRGGRRVLGRFALRPSVGSAGL